MAKAEGGKPRLVIKELVLENFKSYAGVQHVGPFHKNFSSVVGPNGSGKSNVIDAMLFVFGKRAKQLRLNKVSELIHNSTNHRNLESARVSVHFVEIVDGEGEEFVTVEGSEMIVTRTALRNNSSKYYLNDKLSNFTEVTTVLKEKGIDLDHNRFLILQGEVEQISMMKPKSQGPSDEGLLEYLEDIIGTNKYIESIDELAKELEAATEQRDSQVQRLKHVEKERDSLEDAKKEAEIFVNKETELINWQAVLYQLYISQAKANIEQIHVTKDQLEGRLREEKEKQSESDAELKVVKKEYDNGIKQLESMQKELDRTGEQFKEFERRDVQFREDLKHLKAKAKKADDKASKEDQKKVKAEQAAESLREEIPELRTRIGEAESALGPAEAQLSKLQESIKSEVEGYRKKLDTVRGELIPWEKKISEAKASVDILFSEKTLIQENREAALNALEVAKTDVTKALDSHDSKSAELKNAREAHAEKKGEIAAAVTEETKLSDEVKRLTQHARAMQGKHQERKAAQEASRSRGAIVSALLEAKNSGSIKGIWGRLGDLGAVESKFDIAASMSSGALDYIVVDDTSSAQKCVHFLRKKGLGVATFLILEKQKHLIAMAEEPLETPSGSHRLYDLIKVASKELRPAFYFAYRNTLVTKDLDQASKIAYGNDKRFKRVITLDGQLIESSGTMSGGGKKPKGGKICIGKIAPSGKSTSTHVDSVDERDGEASIGDIKSKLKQTEALLKDIRSSIRSAEQEVSETEILISKLEAEVSSLAERINALQDQMKSLEKAATFSKEEKAQLASVSKKLDKAERELETQRSGAAKLHAKAEELNAKIEDAGGRPMQDARARVAELRKEVDDCTADIPSKEVKAESQAKAAAKAEKAAKAAAEEAERIRSEMEEMKSGFQAIESEAMVVMKKYEEAQAAQAAKAEELKQLTATYDEMKEKVALIRTTGVDIESKLEDCSRSLNEEKSNSKHWGNELSKCESQLNDGRTVQGQNLTGLDEEKLSEYSVDDTKYQVAMAEAELEKMKPDMSAIEAYKKKDGEYSERLAALEEVSQQREAHRTVYEDMRRKRLNEFMAGFNIISMKLKEMYQMITLGGDAELELVDSLDPFSEGIVFSVRPPKKSWKNICNLSGGEKTLSSLALVFALHHFKPTPLYVMDEIDAALDFKNVSIVAHYIKERTKDAQFVIISLRNNMFELADRLVGIYKTDNCTKSVSINPGSFNVGTQEAAPTPTPTLAVA